MSSHNLSIQVASIFGLSVDEYRARVNQGEVRNEVLLGYIIELRRQYKTALLSNVPKGSLSRRFNEQELSQYFDKVVTSAEVGYAKPEPEAYEITADRLQVRLDECVFIDDRQRYLEGAQAVGMRTILYQDFAQFRTDLEALLANSQ